MGSRLKLTDGEIEVVYLQAALNSINESVNNDKIELRGTGSTQEVWFKTSNHQNLYSIILVDFLSKPDKDFFDIENPILEFLKYKHNQPAFNFYNSVNDLKKVSTDFSDWLNTEVKFENVWLPAIETELNLIIQRKELIEICGMVLKHNFFKLTRKANKLQKILKRNQVEVNDEDLLIVLEEFAQYFNESGFLTYMGQTIVEFLNNIRLGIHEYLSVEFSRTYTKDPKEEFKYSYKYPNFVTSRFGQTMYWGLMNEIRSRPYMKRFIIPDYLKKLY
jgi:hypothetical protein